MSGPYRDENDSLRAENARLHAQLERRRGANRGLALVLVALDFAAVVVLRPWLNGASDAKFWGGLAIVAGIAISAVISGLFGGRRA